MEKKYLSKKEIRKMKSKEREIFEKMFSHYAKKEMEQFFSFFDPNVNWTVYGENFFAGNYKNIQLLEDAYQRLYEMTTQVKQHVRWIIVEGNAAAAFLYDEIIGKDNKHYTIDYWLRLQLSPQTQKVIQVDNFMDCLQMQKIIKSTHFGRRVA